MERLLPTVPDTELCKEEKQEMNKIKVLKIDKDCFVSKDWLQGYLKTMLLICRAHNVAVTCVKICASQKKGQHFYIWIEPEIDSTTAVRLQYLLGDDSQRVDCCRARIASCLDEWNKLFEVAGRRLRTIYRASTP